MPTTTKSLAAVAVTATEAEQRRTMDEADPLATKIKPSAILETAHRARNTLADASKFVSRRLMRCVDLVVVGIQIDERRGARR